MKKSLQSRDRGNERGAGFSPRPTSAPVRAEPTRGADRSVGNSAAEAPQSTRESQEAAAAAAAAARGARRRNKRRPPRGGMGRNRCRDNPGGAGATGEDRDGGDPHGGPASAAAKRKRRSLVAMWAAAGAAVAIAVAVASATVSLSGGGSSSASRDNPTRPSSPSARPSPALSQSDRPSSPSSSPYPYTSVGSYELLEVVPHSATSFTQGLCFGPRGTSDVVYESTGLYGQSAVQVVNLTSGEVLQSRPMDAAYFGEGLTYMYHNGEEGGGGGGGGGKGGRLVQLTWKERTGFVYDASTLQVVRTFRYSTSTGEGWGITTVDDDGDVEGSSNHTSAASASLLLVSDGSHHLIVWNASTFAEISRVAVLAHFPNSPTPQPVSLLNELEYDPFTRTILANVWYQDFLVRIDRETGRVLTVYDLSSLYPASERDPSSDVLNGIAAVPDRPHEVWVTGKQWPFMYRIRLIDPDR